MARIDLHTKYQPDIKEVEITAQIKLDGEIELDYLPFSSSKVIVNIPNGLPQTVDFGFTLVNKTVILEADLRDALNIGDKIYINYITTKRM